MAKEIEALGRRAVVVPIDVNDNDAVAALVDRCMDAFGRVDIVVNNAGGTMPRPFLDTSPGYLERAFHFNVTTAFVLSKAAVPHMLEQGDGAIVNISSTMGRLRDRGMLAYGTAKAALSAHDPAHGRRPRAQGACERHRGRFRGDVRAADRARRRRDPRGDDPPARRSSDSASPTTSRSPRCTSPPRPDRSSPARSSRSTAASKNPTSSSASRTCRPPLSATGVHDPHPVWANARQNASWASGQVSPRALLMASARSMSRSVISPLSWDMRSITTLL